MKTRVTELLGITYPIIQGGMAWVATHELASAVSNAGGLGIIGAGGAPASWVREQIQAAKKETDKPFGVNLMLMNPDADAIAKVLVEEGPESILHQLPAEPASSLSANRYVRQTRFLLQRPHPRRRDPQRDLWL